MALQLLLVGFLDGLRCCCHTDVLLLERPHLWRHRRALAARLLHLQTLLLELLLLLPQLAGRGLNLHSGLLVLVCPTTDVASETRCRGKGTHHLRWLQLLGLRAG